MRYGTMWRDAVRGVCTAIVAATVGAGLAYAKLPQPPMDDAAKAKAEEARTKAAEAAKKDGEQLAKAQDRVADYYKKSKGMQTTSTTTAAPAKVAKKK